MLLQQLTLQNLLSFGETPCVVPLGDLNVLIGPNGSGKSNFIEAIELLRAAPKELLSPIQEGGGIEEWLWKGNKSGGGCGTIRSQVDLSTPFADLVVHHQLELGRHSQQPLISGEYLRSQSNSTEGPEVLRDVYSFESISSDDLAPKAVLMTGDGLFELEPGDLNTNRSILSQRKDPNRFPEITLLAEDYERIQIYREWSFGRRTPPRLAQRTTDRNDRLLEDFSNLGMMMNRMRRVSETKHQFLEMLNKLYPNIDDFDVSIEGGAVQVFFQEGKFTIPATRLSDGTLRYLCLLVILLQPTPPPLVCIEEPELGLHPDVLPPLADLLVEASHRMQLIVTTHSDVLIDALSESPEDIVICEKHEGQTTMRRLDQNALAHWLNEYSLGELWRSGQLGGNRW